MHKVQLMTQMPTTCLTCGRGNTPNEPDTIDEFWALDMERDVNWGDSTYVCKYCVDQIAAIAGFVTVTQLDEAQQIIDQFRTKLHDKQAELDLLKERVRAKLVGDQAAQALLKQTKQKTKQGKPKAKKAA